MYLNERDPLPPKIGTIMSKIQMLKIVTRILVGAGTTSVTNSIIRNNVEPTNLFQSISVGVAAVTIGSMASEATKEHASTQIDALVDLFNKSSETTESPIND